MNLFLHPWRALCAFWRTPDPMMARQALVVGVAAVVLTLLGWGAALGYKELRFHRHLHLAAERLEANRLEDAAHFLKRARMERPTHPAVYRAMADYSLASRSPDHLHWLEKLSTARPRDRKLALELAAAYLQAGRTREAAALAESLVPHPDQRGAAENVLGIAAQREGRADDAESHFRNAVQAAPESPAFLTNLAAHLMTRHPAGSPQDGEIEALLARLAQLPGSRTAAQRLRVGYLDSRGRGADALAASSLLIQAPRAPVTDFLRHLELLAAHDRGTYPSFRAQTLQRALQTPADSVQCLSWLLERGALAEARDLVDALAAAHLRFPTLLIGIAEFHRRSANWAALRTVLDSGRWEGCETYRLLYAAELASAEGRSEDTVRAIQLQAIQASPSPHQLFAVLRLTATWPGWAAAREPLLIRLSRLPTWRYAALQGLASIYLEARQADPLGKVEKALWQIRPESREHRLRFAGLALLNGRDVAEAAAVIESLVQESPKDPRTVYLAARYDLFLKRPEKALQRIEALPEAVRFSPEFALFTAQICASLPGHQAAALRAWKQVARDTLIDAETQLWKELGKNLAQPTALARADHLPNGTLP